MIFSPSSILGRVPPLVSGYLPASIDQFSASLLGFLFHLVTARHYGTKEYGWLVLMWGVGAFLVLLWRGLLGVPFVVDASSQDDPDSRATERGRLWKWTKRACVASLGGSVLMAAVALTISAPSGISPLLVAAGFLVGAFLYREAWRHILISELRTGELGTLGLASNGLAALALFLVVVTLGQAPWLAVSVLAVASVVGVLLVRPRDLSIGHDEPTYGIARWWSFGRHIVLGVLALNGTSQALLWLILFFHDESVVAVFGAVMALSGLPRPVINAVTAILTPRVAIASRSNSDDESPGAGRLLLGVIVVAPLLGFGGAYLGPFALELLFPTIPVASGLLVGLLMGSVGLEAGNGVLRGLLRGRGLPQGEAAAAAAAAVVGAGVGLAAIGPMGPEGAAIAVIALQGVFLLVGLWFWTSGRDRAVSR